MKKQIEEISSMLDQIRGGLSNNGLFPNYTGVDDIEICTLNCPDDCGKDMIGQSIGEKKGNKYPGDPIVIKP